MQSNLNVALAFAGLFVNEAGTVESSDKAATLLMYVRPRMSWEHCTPRSLLCISSNPLSGTDRMRAPVFFLSSLSA
jgi:hypothetical protein